MFKRSFLFLIFVSLLMFTDCLIKGKVVDGNGVGVAGVTITLTGAASMSTTTDSNGDYQFGTLDNLLTAGNYTVTPSGYVTPASRDVTINNQTLENGDAVPWPKVDINFETISNVNCGENSIVLEDNFPGYQEESGWDDSWTQGVGSIQYFSEKPGFARLILSGPGGAERYHNAEKKHSGGSHGFLYCDVEMRLRNSNNNGWDAPNAATAPDSNYGYGSRGWGLWNNQMPPANATIIWFDSISPESDKSLRGTRLWIVLEGVPVLFQDLNIDLTKWHIYRIEWRQNYINVYIDDMLHAVAEIKNKAQIPNEPLAFTAWIDNYRIVGDLSNLDFQYLEVPDIEQYIDVDYIRICE